METGYCQSPITFHRQLSVNDLKDRQVNKIDRDSSGYFWLLETSVIQKYDGRFVTENLSHPVVNPKYFKCLKDDLILLVSQEAEIYTINQLELAIKEINTDLVECPSCNLLDVNLIKDEVILFYQSKDSIIVYKMDFIPERETKRIDAFQFPKINEVANVFKVGSEYLITNTSEQVLRYDEFGITELDLAVGMRETKEALVSEFISEKELYFSLPKRKGAYKYKDSKIEVLHPEYKLAFAKKDIKERILLGLSRTFNHSEELYIQDSDSLMRWRAITDFNETYIDAYIEDLDDEVLLGSHSGLYYFKLRSPAILPTHQSTTLTNGFGNVILSITETSDGQILYVKENKGIFEYRGKEGPNWLELSNFLENNLNITFDPIDNRLWISGYTDQRTGVLFSYDQETKHLDRYDFNMPVMYFERFQDNNLMLSNSVNLRSNILLYNPESKLVVDTVLTLQNERTRRFTMKDDNEMLVGTSKRLLSLDLVSREVKTIVPEVFVQSIVPISNGYAICSRGKGVIFLNENLNIVRIVDELSGLSNNHIYSVTEANDGFYWIGTGNGLNVLDTNYTFMNSYNTYDGLSSHELNTNASYKLDNGNLLFGTINGITEIEPNRLLTSHDGAVFSTPSLSYEIDGDNITQRIRSNKITLNSSAKNIAINMISNTFYELPGSSSAIYPRVRSIPEKLDYLIKEKSVVLPKLEYDRISLSISPSNPQNGVQVSELQIDKKRNFRTAYFIFGLLAISALLSYLAANYIIKYNKRRSDERRENEVKMAELELQALRSQMNPHFIFNSLGAILLYLQTNEKKKAEKYLTKFAKLMRMFLESSKAKFITFKEEKELLKLYLDLEKLRFEDKFNFEIKLDPRIDINSFTLPSMLLQPFVENSINHGLYHKKGTDGKLEISAIPDGNNVKIIIQDNGIGRVKSREIRENSLKKHRSRATEIIQERIGVLKKEKNIDIDIEYEDLYDDQGASLGTKVVISIPKLPKS